MAFSLSGRTHPKADTSALWWTSYTVPHRAHSTPPRFRRSEKTVSPAATLRNRFALSGFPPAPGNACLPGRFPLTGPPGWTTYRSEPDTQGLDVCAQQLRA